MFFFIALGCLASSMISDLVPFLAICKESAQVRGDRDQRRNGPAPSSSGSAQLINLIPDAFRKRCTNTCRVAGTALTRPWGRS